MNAYVLDRDGTVHPRVDRVNLESRLTSGEFFWLDLHAPGEEEFQLLRDVFKFHPLALEDSEQFGQRAKVEDYGDFVFLVFFGASPPPMRIASSRSTVSTPIDAWSPSARTRRRRATRFASGMRNARPRPRTRSPSFTSCSTH